MIDLNIVKEQYQRMSDEEIARFAKNESQGLTLESFHLLKSELEVRGIDSRIIEQASIDRDLAEVTKVSEFEAATANAFLQTIWKFALKEKEKGKSNDEIFNSLIAKNIAHEYAFMIIENLEEQARDLVESFQAEIITGWVLLIAGVLLSFFTLNSTSHPGLFIFWGLAIIIAGVVRLATSYSKKRKYQTVIENIEEEQKRSNNLYQ